MFISQRQDKNMSLKRLLLVAGAISYTACAGVCMARQYVLVKVTLKLSVDVFLLSRPFLKFAWIVLAREAFRSRLSLGQYYQFLSQVKFLRVNEGNGRRGHLECACLQLLWPSSMCWPSGARKEKLASGCLTPKGIPLASQKLLEKWSLLFFFPLLLSENEVNPCTVDCCCLSFPPGREGDCCVSSNTLWHNRCCL